MTQPGSITSAIPPGIDDLSRRITDLERKVQLYQAARGLESSSIGAGGLDVNPGGTGLAIERGTSPYFPTEQVGQIRFHSRYGNDPAVIISPEDTSGQPMFLGLFSGQTAALGQGDIIIQDGLVVMDATDGVHDAQAWVVAGAGAPDGNASFHAINTEIYQNRISISGIGFTQNALTDLRAQLDNATYVVLRASAFTVSSSKAVKKAIKPIEFDALDLVNKAPAFQWRYRKDHAVDDQTVHYGPVLEDLPESMDSDGGVDLRDLVGLLWAAVQQLSARVTELESG